MIKRILSGLQLDEDDVYSYLFESTQQDAEVDLREAVASKSYGDYLGEISKNHSVPVMDREVDLFLAGIPSGGIIADIGGCWGWHWRRLASTRPDVTLFVVDFIRSSFVHTKAVLGDQINQNVFLVHGDATALVFDDDTFDGVWSVQTFQHIPNIRAAISEAWRVLKPGGIFANYSLNSPALVKLIYWLARRHYHVEGHIPGAFYLARASGEQLGHVEEIFANKCRRRYSEVIFSPELGIGFPGEEGSFIGKLDGYLSSDTPVLAWIARQQSFHTFKI